VNGLHSSPNVSETAARPIPSPSPSPLGFPDGKSFADSRNFIEVRSRTFVNEHVLLDGYRYINCNFINVTFVYNGTAPFALKDNTIGGLPKIKTENEVITGAWAISKAFHAFDMTMVDDNNQPIQNIEAIQIPDPSPSPRKLR